MSVKLKVQIHNEQGRLIEEVWYSMEEEDILEEDPDVDDLEDAFSQIILEHLDSGEFEESRGP